MSQKKTIDQHKSNGTYRPGKHGKEEDFISVDKLNSIPRPPTHLGKYGKKEWSRLLKNLIDNEIVAELDLGLLELACSEYNIYRECQEFIVEKNQGDRNLSVAKYLNGRNSQTIVIRTEMKQAFRNYFDVVAKFGVSAAERAKIPTTKKKEEGDEFSEFESEQDNL